MQAKIIEDNKNNVQNDTTGIGLLDNQKIQNLQDWLRQVSQVMLYIHKLQIRTCVGKEYYDDLTDIKPAPVNGAKTYEQRIGQSHAPQNVDIVILANSIF